MKFNDFNKMARPEEELDILNREKSIIWRHRFGHLWTGAGTSTTSIDTEYYILKKISIW